MMLWKISTEKSLILAETRNTCDMALHNNLEGTDKFLTERDIRWDARKRFENLTWHQLPLENTVSLEEK